jgi:hypothetical protein
MRMWNVPVVMLCNKHLLGEHVEMHMFVGCLMKNKKLNSYINKGLVDLFNLPDRHRKLSEEMSRRGMHHRSELLWVETWLNDYWPKWGEIDISKNIDTLTNRCSNCRKLYEANSLKVMHDLCNFYQLIVTPIDLTR